MNDAAWPDLGFRLHHARTLAVKVIPFSGETPSGITITHSENMPVLHGLLVAIHPTCDARLKYGDFIRFERYAGEELVIEHGEDAPPDEYLVIHEDDVTLAIEGTVVLAYEQEEAPVAA